MADCPVNINLIYGDENIGDSLGKINTNFQNLKQGACAIESELDDLVSVRTFFYYGPNAPTESEAGSWEQDNQLNRPSDVTIENFVNNTNQLNLPTISQIGDIAYVIYQKTGWYTQATDYARSGSGRLPFDRLTYYTFQYQAQKTRLVPYTVAITRRIGIGGKGGGKCFTGDTLVQTPNGNIFIKDIKVGNIVYGYTPDSNKKIPLKVLKMHKNCWEDAHHTSPLIEIIHENGILKVVEGHWLYTKSKKYKEAKDFKQGDYLVLNQNEKTIYSKILQINKNVKYNYIYNITVEELHNFIANDVCVGDFETDELTILKKDKFRLAYKIFDNQSPKWEIFNEWLASKISSKVYNLLDKVLYNISQKIPLFKDILNYCCNFVIKNKSYETYVTTPTGPKNIKALKKGDKIFGFTNDLYLTEQTVLEINKKPKVKCIKIYHENGELILSESQLVYINGKYIKAKNIKINDNLILLENTGTYKPHFDILSKILKIETLTEELEYHELKISDNENYIANGVFVHNGGGGGTVTTLETRYRQETYTVTETTQGSQIETYYVGYSWETNINDQYNYYTPIFVIYRLTYNGTQYIMDSGFPKFSRANTASTINWNNPRTWTTY